MIDPVFHARRIAQWTDLVGTLPKPLATELAKLQAVTAVDSEPRRPDLTKLTVDNAEAIVRELAADIAASKVMYEGRNRIADSIARDILQMAGDHAAELRDHLNPAFANAAQAYTDAVAVIGDSAHTPAALIAAGPAAVAAFHTAIDAQRDIEAMESWVAGLTALPKYPYGIDPVCRITAPTTRAELQALEDARGKAGDLNSLYCKAIENGVPLALNLPDEAAEIRTAIEAQPVVHRNPFAKLVTR